MRAVSETNRVSVPNLPEKAGVQYGAPAYIFVTADSAAEAGTAVYRLVPVMRGVGEDCYPVIYPPTAETGKPLRFVTEGTYYLLGKLKNAEEEE